MQKDKKAVKALKAVRVVIAYLNAEETCSSNTEWVDSKGYAMDCDLGYFYDGLTKFAELLEKRIRRSVPRYPQACCKYLSENK